MFCAVDLVYVDSPPAIKAAEGTMPDKEPSRKLRPIKDGLYQIINFFDHTLMVDISAVHNIVSIEKVTLAESNEAASPSVTTTSPKSSGKGLSTEGVCCSAAGTSPKEKNMSSVYWLVTSNVMEESNIEYVDENTHQPRTLENR